MHSPIEAYCIEREKEFNAISPERKKLLEGISDYVTTERIGEKLINLLYICTHNSRRSHFGQIWAKVAADYYGVEEVNTFSGGTEATSFNINAINTLKRVGFIITPIDIELNTHYNVYYSQHQEPIISFSKMYQDPVNPKKEFAAIMTCGEAEENCPFIPGAELRIGTTYDDPKTFDNTLQQDSKYDECCKQIALETMYVFSKIK